ncbi:hypothetical protein Pmar_PMAR022243 [Perkinsus marinus ATCC 50983]|uniref:Uncharacterized protein n=1 Tax=Perkinsus marinus (strain ATCC 50983 / TXsc) TaxID=423536 RepID=C5KDK4_PERM5|nr:hypothetical protein Pmar_PMAR022243 [Perkinsus marinus ATCC 50983]EER17307.1 hypothetical protein Pmar_PMAR022243 [Perkinsus marinus ATCC 50983]|eukprot:XP_002785511.1 hypothetical protein Pmar_PMAR022243 [Perkinsus marinus ATCC 50983]
MIRRWVGNDLEDIYHMAVMLEREEVLKQCQLKAVEGGERIEDQLVDALRQVIYAQRNGEEIDRRFFFLFISTTLCYTTNANTSSERQQ